MLKHIVLSQKKAARKKKCAMIASALQLTPWRESPASWMMAMRISPIIRQATWWVWQRQCKTWWEAGSSQPAARVAARKTALMMKPTGYRVNLMSVAWTAGLCGACSGQANTLAIWLNSLILSTQNWPVGKTTPFISRPPSGCNTASFVSPRIVKLSDFGQVGNPATISTTDDAFGKRGGASAVSFKWTQVFPRSWKVAFSPQHRRTRGLIVAAAWLLVDFFSLHTSNAFESAQ